MEYIVSADGTVIALDDCVVIDMTIEEATSLCDNYSDSERYEIARELLNAKEYPS